VKHALFLDSTGAKLNSPEPAPNALERIRFGQMTEPEFVILVSYKKEWSD
jgi:hypothetical protein